MPAAALTGTSVDLRWPGAHSPVISPAVLSLSWQNGVPPALSEAGLHSYHTFCKAGRAFLWTPSSERIDKTQKIMKSIHKKKKEQNKKNKDDCSRGMILLPWLVHQSWSYTPILTFPKAPSNQMLCSSRLANGDMGQYDISVGGVRQKPVCMVHVRASNKQRLLHCLKHCLCLKVMWYQLQSKQTHRSMETIRTQLI